MNKKKPSFFVNLYGNESPQYDLGDGGGINTGSGGGTTTSGGIRGGGIIEPSGGGGTPTGGNGNSTPVYENGGGGIRVAETTGGGGSSTGGTGETGGGEVVDPLPPSYTVPTESMSCDQLKSLIDYYSSIVATEGGNTPAKKYLQVANNIYATKSCGVQPVGGGSGGIDSSPPVKQTDVDVTPTQFPAIDSLSCPQIYAKIKEMEESMQFMRPTVEWLNYLESLRTAHATKCKATSSVTTLEPTPTTFPDISLMNCTELDGEIKRLEALAVTDKSEALVKQIEKAKAQFATSCKASTATTTVTTTTNVNPPSAGTLSMKSAPPAGGGGGGGGEKPKSNKNWMWLLFLAAVVGGIAIAASGKGKGKKGSKTGNK